MTHQKNNNIMKDLKDITNSSESSTPRLHKESPEDAPMIRLGKRNRLEVLREVDFGMYLNAGDVGDVLLP